MNQKIYSKALLAAISYETSNIGSIMGSYCESIFIFGSDTLAIDCSKFGTSIWKRVKKCINK